MMTIVIWVEIVVPDNWNVWNRMRLIKRSEGNIMANYELGG